LSGHFITFEGGEGVGKSTQLRLLADALTEKGLPVTCTREPGGSPGAERLRTFLLAGGHELSPDAEVLVHFASRMDHIERTIRPALEAGHIVLCDRFTDSTLAYQGYGLSHGDPARIAFIERLIELVGLVPDATLLFSAPRAQARKRVDARGGAADRYERLDELFHDRVAAGYQALAAAHPRRIHPIDASPPAELVQRDVLRVVERLLPA